MPSKGTPRRTIRVADDLWSAASRKANSEGRDVSDVVREHLEHYVDEPGDDQAGDTAAAHLQRPSAPARDAE